MSDRRPRGQPPVRLPILGDLIREDLVLRIWCNTCQTGGRDIDPKLLVGRYGPDTPIEEISARLRCERCGTKTATTQAGLRDPPLSRTGE